jgi:hypothetical protein
LLQIKASKQKAVHRYIVHSRTWKGTAMTGSNMISRRRVLTVAAGAVTGAAIVDSPKPAHAAKAPQKAVKYQDTPKGDQSCANCALFEPPSSCKTVDGTVSPEGWCMVYAKKPT